MQSQGFDAYNQNATGDVSKPLNNAATDSDYVPCVYTLNGKDTTPPLDAHYYLGAGARSGVEREAVLMCEGGTAWDGGDISPTLTANNASGAQRMPDKDNFNAVITYGIDRASFNQGANAQYNFSVEEEKAQTLVAKGPGGVLTGQ